MEDRGLRVVLKCFVSNRVSDVCVRCDLKGCSRVVKNIVRLDVFDWVLYGGLPFGVQDVEFSWGIPL